MPKNVQSSLSKMRAQVARYPAEFMATARGELLRTLCSTIVSYDREFSIHKHRQSPVVNIAARTAAAKHTNNIISTGMNMFPKGQLLNF